MRKRDLERLRREPLFTTPVRDALWPAFGAVLLALLAWRMVVAWTAPGYVPTPEDAAFHAQVDSVAALSEQILAGDTTVGG